MKLLAVDSNSILNRAYYGVRPLTTKDGVYTHAVYGFINILLKILEDVKPDCVAFCFDVKRETFRNEIYKEYKGTRKATPPELRAQFPLIKEFIRLWGYEVLELEGYEADDIIGTLAASSGENEVVIATGDRDSLQLIKSNVSVRLASTKMGQPEAILYTEKEVFEKYKTTPKGLIEIKALMGDSSDNIPGVPGIGEKGAIDLIGKYGSIEYIYDNLDSLEITERLRGKLLSGKESAFISKRLGTIFCSVPIETDFSLYVKKETSDELPSFLKRLELFSTMKKLGITDSKKEDAPISYEVVSGEEALSALEKADKLYCDFKFEGETATLFFAKENKAYIVSDIGAIKKAFLEKEIFSVSSKKIYKFLSDEKLVCFDLELAAYLLSANMASYSPQNLCSAYSLPYPKIEGEDSEYISGVLALKKLSSLLYEKLKETENLKLYKEIELPLARVLADMENRGVLVDKNGIASFGEMLSEKIAEKTEEIYKEAGKEFNINSPKQLGEVLFSDLSIPGGKKTKSGYSTNADVLESLKDSYKIVADVLEYRKLSKLNSTYVQGLLKTISEDGRIHTTFNQTETRTGRISSIEPNLQNIPVRSDLGKEMRKFFMAEDGKKLVDADYSQIELRVLAHISGDKALNEAFHSGEDVHKKAAMSVFGLPSEMITEELRRRAKAVNFGIVYGIGAFSLSGDIGVSVKEAREYIKNYLTVYSGVDSFMKNSVDFAKREGYVSTLFGRRRYIPELSASNRMIASFGERVAMNAPIQGTAADIIKIAMIKVFERLKKEKLDAALILQIHDELIIECKDSDTEIIEKLLKEEMENAVNLSVELIADVKSGRTWFDTK